MSGPKKSANFPKMSKNPSIRWIRFGDDSAVIGAGERTGCALCHATTTANTQNSQLLSS